MNNDSAFAAVRRRRVQCSKIWWIWLANAISNFLTKCTENGMNSVEPNSLRAVCNPAVLPLQYGKTTAIIALIISLAFQNLPVQNWFNLFLCAPWLLRFISLPYIKPKLGWFQGWFMKRRPTAYPGGAWRYVDAVSVICVVGDAVVADRCSGTDPNTDQT